MKLSYFEIVPLIPNLPQCVINDIAAAHGTKPDFLHVTMRDVSPPYTHEDWRYIARFINPYVEWQLEPLKTSFRFYQEQMSLDLSKVPTNFSFGFQTQDQPFNFNTPLMCAFCLKYGVKVYPEMRPEQLAYCLRSLLFPSYYLVGQLIPNLMNLSSAQLANIGVELTQELRLPKVITHDALKSIKIPTQIYEPLEAVAFAAKKFSLDISSSPSPLEEYYILKQCSSPDEYTPFDPQMRYYYFRNPRLYLLTYHFNPLFPARYYSVLNTLVSEYGYESSFESYSLLCEEYYCNNFYHGIRPGIKNKESLFLYETDVSSNSLLCFGNSYDGYVFLTYVGLARYFHHTKAFLHPLEKSILDEHHIKRLSNLARLDYPHDTPEDKENREKLIEAITEVNLFNTLTEEKVKSFLEKYNSSPDPKVQEILKGLLEIAMYMRGWEPGKEYPVTEAYDCDERDINVTHAITNWEANLSPWEEILDLPLVRYVNNWLSSNDETIGKTIGEKIRLVKIGEDSYNVSGTCIRISSGWLACSAYRYMCLIGMSPPFPIHKFVYIS